MLALANTSSITPYPLPSSSLTLYLYLTLTLTLYLYLTLTLTLYLYLTLYLFLYLALPLYLNPLMAYGRPGSPPAGRGRQAWWLGAIVLAHLSFQQNSSHQRHPRPINVIPDCGGDPGQSVSSLVNSVHSEYLSSLDPLPLVEDDGHGGQPQLRKY